MRPRWLVLCLLWALLCPGWLAAQTLAPIPPLDAPVVDSTATLEAEARQVLVQQALALQQRKGAQLQILIVPTTGAEPIEAYTQRVFDQWKLGRKGLDDAVLMVVAKDDRRVRIQPGYGLEGAIPDAIANRIIQEYLVPHFRADDYAGGITAATAVLVGLIDGEELPPPVSSNQVAPPGADEGSFVFAIFIGGFFSVLMRLLFSRGSRPLRGLAAAVLAGGAGWLLLSALGAGIAAVAALFLSIGNASAAGFARGGGFGRGGFGGGGGWSGGGGRSGGGGASGSW